ncbi:MAG: hypothetical protein MZV49_05130 [Rhodopseudomonas palustris]|nr:hypothetical protein [Rhodopseudomonas palustris]
MPEGPGITIEVPKDPKFGDYSTPLALTLAKAAGRKPREIADEISRLVAQKSYRLIDRTEVAGPGFINFYLSDAWMDYAIKAIRKAKCDYGRSAVGQGAKVNVEFVSANPVGPLNIVNARAAAVGDSLTRMMSFAGYDAKSEFYVNDAGNQVDILAESVYARYRQSLGEEYAFPEEGYRGLYVQDIASKAAEKLGSALSALPSRRRPRHSSSASHWTACWSGRRSHLKAYNVEFDAWTSEKSLRDAGAVEHTIERMRAKGDLYESEGALWFRSTSIRRRQGPGS